MTGHIAMPSRLRRTAKLRALVRENHLMPSDLVQPLFLIEGQQQRREVPSMPGIEQLSIDQAVAEAQELHAFGIPAVILFGVPENARKDACGHEAWNNEGLVQQAARRIKEALPDMLVIADACFCEYTDHGHCGPLLKNGQRDDDRTLEQLQRLALSYGENGVDIIAPSGMVDGMVAAIREALDAAGRQEVSILSYAVKYASAFYGPFRDAAQSTPQFGDRKSYQMDPANAREAMREWELDVEEGADMLMVKPGLAYLDIVRAMRERTHLPIAAYNVSGEYAMVKAAARQGWIDEQAVVLETLLCFKRAGADYILSYHAKDAARWLAGKG